MKKKFPTRQLLQGVIVLLLLLSSILFLCGLGQSVGRRVVLLAIALLVTGLIGLMGASSLPANSGAPEWPMIQGLLDVMMGIMLLMSYGTRLPSLLLLLLAIWALMGAAARLFSAFKFKLNRRMLLQSVCSLVGSALFFAGALIPSFDPALAAGLALIFCAASNFWLSPRKR